MLSRRKISLLIVLAASLFCVEAKSVKRDSITIFGRVLCEGKPLADVAVSDGVHIVKTDSLGRYSIASHKFQNTVFVITPSGYEPECKKRILPRFWASLEKKREVAEQHDFNLVKRDQSNHRILFMSNLFLHNANDDLLQFKRKTVPAARRIKDEVSDSTAVYTILLGDISNCPMWYSREFDVGDAVSLIASLRYPTMLYTVMGDQDNDGAIPGTGLTDYKAERQYVYTCGPKYYSMNIGDIHYVVLDNTVFRNEAGKGKYPTEIVGKRNYDRFVTIDQLDWLRKDLALVKDKSQPIVVCMHQTAFMANSKNRISKRFSKPEELDSLTKCFAGFKNVHFMTAGSTDRRIAYTKELPNIISHEVGSTSGDRWKTGHNGFAQIAAGGVPAGFEIFDVKGRKISWHYTAENGEDKPFRVYDMAKVGESYKGNSDMQNLLREYPKTYINYDTPEFKKYIYVNWWGNEKGAKLEVFENNKALRVRQIHQADPLFVATSSAITLKNSRNKKPRMGKNNCSHLFRVERTSPTSTIKVKATTPFGEVYEEIIVGNKEFSPQTK